MEGMDGPLINKGAVRPIPSWERQRIVRPVRPSRPTHSCLASQWSTSILAVVVVATFTRPVTGLWPRWSSPCLFHDLDLFDFALPEHFVEQTVDFVSDARQDFYLVSSFTLGMASQDVADALLSVVVLLP